MKPFVRRSHLVVPILDRERVETSWTHNTDAVVLDLRQATSHRDRARARQLVRESIAQASIGGAEVFVRVSNRLAQADIDASIWPGLAGVVFPGAETGEEIARVDEILTSLEQQRGIEENTLQIIVELDSGKGIWNIREIVRASTRVCSASIDDIGLCRDMGIVSDADFDPFVYAKGRVVIESRAAKVQPVGISHPLGVLPSATDDIYTHALKSKNLGFAGAMCPDSAWVGHCNRAFAPPEEKLELYRETRRLFAEGVAQGTAAIPFPGTTMMIDVPVDENARVNLDLWKLCESRETEKLAAVERADKSRP
jgi:citrate lyase subunit beta/citryl-CoA lyase